MYPHYAIIYVSTKRRVVYCRLEQGDQRQNLKTLTHA